MNIITFDGHSGAGKSTQSNLLVKHLDKLRVKKIGHIFWRMKYLTDELFDLAGFDYTYIRGMPEMLRVIMIYRMMEKYWRKRGYDIVIVDDFFLKSFRRCDINTLEADNLIGLFRDMLTVQSGIEPIASFYIDVPGNDCHTRTFYRDSEHDANQISIDLDRSVISDEDRHNTEKWVALSERIPYLHIIDGTQSIDGISKEIISIVDQAHE